MLNLEIMYILIYSTSKRCTEDYVNLDKYYFHLQTVKWTTTSSWPRPSWHFMIKNIEVNAENSQSWALILCFFLKKNNSRIKFITPKNPLIASLIIKSFLVPHIYMKNIDILSKLINRINSKTIHHHYLQIV